MILSTIAFMLGRLLFAYALVFFIVLMFKKFKLKAAYNRVHSLLGMSAVSLAFLLPIFATMGQRI